MATKPQQITLTNSSVDIINAIRNSASINYRNYVPKATADVQSIRKIGAIIMDYPALQNEFLNALINRIGRVIVTSKQFYNPWAKFKRGLLEMGETVEEIFVDIAKPFQFDPVMAESTVFKREKPDVRSAFHPMNYQKFYKVTVSTVQLKQAFLSWSGITDLIAKITESMYTGANYDEFQVMKYLLAVHITEGKLRGTEVPTVSTSNMKMITSRIKGVSNQLEFPTRNYNLSGVLQHTPKENQILIVNSVFDAVTDVEVLASAFNMNKAEFMGQRVLVDSFGSLDVDRLDTLFATDDTYHHFTKEELTALDGIPAVLVDKDYFMIFDNEIEFTEQLNSEGLYWNWFYHTWKTFSVSPFANCTVFVQGKPAIESISVSPSVSTASIGQQVQLTSNVKTNYFAPQSVTWKSSDPLVTVDNAGLVNIGGASGTSVTITATSTFDNTKKATATINLV